MEVTEKMVNWKEFLSGLYETHGNTPFDSVFLMGFLDAQIKHTRFKFDSPTDVLKFQFKRGKDYVTNLYISLVDTERQYWNRKGMLPLEVARVSLRRFPEYCEDERKCNLNLLATEISRCYVGWKSVDNAAYHRLQAIFEENEKPVCRICQAEIGARDNCSFDVLYIPSFNRFVRLWLRKQSVLPPFSFDLASELWESYSAEGFQMKLKHEVCPPTFETVGYYRDLLSV